MTEQKPRGRPRKSRATLAPREAECLALITSRASVGGITKRSIMAEMSIQEPTAATYLTALRNAGHIRHIGFNGGASHVVWVPNTGDAPELRLPDKLQKRCPSIFHLGAML